MFIYIYWVQSQGLVGDLDSAAIKFYRVGFRALGLRRYRVQGL